MAQSLRDPAGQTVVQVTGKYASGTTTVSAANTAETSVAILNAGVWREAVLLVNVSTLSATTPQLIVNLWALDQQGNRYPLPATAPAANGFISKTYTAASRSRDAVSPPIGGTVEITYNTGTSSGTVNIVFAIEVQFKSA